MNASYGKHPRKHLVLEVLDSQIKRYFENFKYLHKCSSSCNCCWQLITQKNAMASDQTNYFNLRGKCTCISFAAHELYLIDELDKLANSKYMTKSAYIKRFIRAEARKLKDHQS